MRFCLAAGALALAASLEPAFAAESLLSGTREVVSQWVQTRQLVAKTRSDGEAMKELLAQSKAIHERELQGMAEVLSRTSTNNTQIAEERLKAERELQESNLALEKAKGSVVELEGLVRGLLRLLPPPLVEQAKPALDRIPADSQTARGGVTERLQAVVTLLVEVDKFQQTVTVAAGRQADASGREVSVETLYLGLGAAFFSDPTGQVAGVGKPGNTGWEWQLKPDLGADILSALAMYRNSKPAAFVGLPVTLGR